MDLTLMSKYTPKTIDEVILDEKILDPIIAFANGWMQGFPNMNKPALLLYGKPGTGKTMTTRALCNDCEWSIIELNSSSIRTKEQLKGLLNIPSIDFFGRKVCLFLDEADSLEGGEYIIKKIIMQLKFPVILAANDQYKVPKALRDICEPVQFFRPSAKALKQHLLRINRDEGLCLPIEIIDNAAESQDYRMAFNILESKQKLQGKEKKMSLVDCTKNIMLKEEAKFDDTKSILYYIDENAPKLYDVLDLQEIFETAITVDKYNRRGQISFANSLIKEIPKTPAEIEEINIKYPIFYEKSKKNQETN
jgi:DNA polymerase III delta prime subunit